MPLNSAFSTIRTLEEPDCIEAIRQKGYTFQLSGHEFHLFIDVLVLIRGTQV